MLIIREIQPLKKIIAPKLRILITHVQHSSRLVYISSYRMFEVQSCVRDYHVYQNVWTSYVGEVLSCAKEP